MLFRVILKPSRYVYILSRNYSSQLSSQIQSSSVFPSSSFPLPSSPPFTPFLSTLFYCRHFSSNNNSNDGKEQDSSSDLWKLASENDNMDIFGKEDGDFSGVAEGDPGVERLKQTERLWAAESGSEGISKEFGESNGSGASVGDSEWAFSEIETWDSKEEDKVEDLFDIRDIRDDEREKEKRIEDIKQLEMEEVTLKDVLKGPNRAFGDLVAASGITDDMLDSLFALKDFDGVTGLPPLSEIEDLHYEKTTRKSTMAEMERQKQEEVAKARVRMVDEKGRAYGTGKRKCSIARVWIQPGEGKFLVNDKEFDVYFPMLDHRAALLRPFSETQTLGLWDVRCTVKGGGVSGQVGAVRLGISRALQNWEPGLRPQLKEVGFLTRDPRIVERKKPGKAKARKSFQWVKR